MPTPIGHSLAGYAIYASLKGRTRQNWRLLTLSILIANLADIDYLFGFIVGNPNLYHHTLTHSLTFAIISGAILGTFFALKSQERVLKYFLIFVGLYLSHLLLDYLTLDTSPPYGEQLFWPFTKKYFISPVYIFTDIHKASTNKLFFVSLFAVHNLWAVIRECIVLLPVILISKYKNQRKICDD